MRWPLRVRVPCQLRTAVVAGPSMVPTLRDGDRLLVRVATGAGTPQTGRLVLVALPERPLSVKRLVEVEPDGRIVVHGDNTYGSTDSRQLGPLDPAALRGVVLARLWPRPASLL